ncbi:MAG: hypothetical protein RIC24_16155 [Hyphomicrobiales bacterium]|jgi:hypothetical protein
MVRLLLIVVLTLSASISGALGAGYSVMQDHDHTAVESVENDPLTCCDNGVERAHSCLTMPAMFEGAGAYYNAKPLPDALFDTCELMLTGIQPSGPLDPPRML